MPRQRLGTTLHRLAERVEHAQALDPVAAAMEGVADRALPRSGPVKELLSGSWLGHPAHPLSTFVPIGLWTASGVLDLLGDRRAADRLVAGGVLAALPTATAGLSDWKDMTGGGDRRVGVVHAASNLTATALFAASAVARYSGDRRRGRLLAMGGHAAVTLGGFLGSHLAYVRGIGVNRTTFEERVEGWQPAGDRPLRVEGDHALGTRCTHCGTALDDQLTCPRDGSRFRDGDGAVLQGPATTPLPVYDVRGGNGAVEIAPRGQGFRPRASAR